MQWNQQAIRTGCWVGGRVDEQPPCGELLRIPCHNLAYSFLARRDTLHLLDAD